MSTFKVTISIEVDGPILGDTHPKRLDFTYDRRTGDNPRFYASELRQTVAEATETVMNAFASTSERAT